MVADKNNDRLNNLFDGVQVSVNSDDDDLLDYEDIVEVGEEDDGSIDQDLDDVRNVLRVNSDEENIEVADQQQQ